MAVPSGKFVSLAALANDDTMLRWNNENTNRDGIMSCLHVPSADIEEMLLRCLYHLCVEQKVGGSLRVKMNTSMMQMMRIYLRTFTFGASHRHYYCAKLQICMKRSPITHERTRVSCCNATLHPSARTSKTDVCCHRQSAVLFSSTSKEVVTVS